MAIKVTQALIYAELQIIKDTLRIHSDTDMHNFRELRQLLEGTEDTPGIKIRVDRLEQAELSKQRNFNYLWMIVSGLAVSIAVAFFT